MGSGMPAQNEDESRPIASERTSQDHSRIVECGFFILIVAHETTNPFIGNMHGIGIGRMGRRTSRGRPRGVEYRFDLGWFNPQPWDGRTRATTNRPSGHRNGTT